MDFDIYDLKIVISPNLKNKKEIILTKDLIHSTEEGFSIGSELGTYPCFTSDVMYSRSKLIPLNYQERVNFFFNKDKFKELLPSYKTTISTSTKKDDIVENNIMVMLEILLPTKFPAVKDLKQSYKTILDKDTVLDHLYEPYLTTPFSYLKLDGKIHTVKRVVWLNDILNNPIYRKLFDSYKKFMVWSKEAKMNITIIIDKLVTNLIKSTKSAITDIVELINIYIDENADTELSFFSGQQKNQTSTYIQLESLNNILYLLTLLNGLDITLPTINNKQLMDELDKRLTGIKTTINDELSEFKKSSDEYNNAIFERIIKLLDPKQLIFDDTKFLYGKKKGNKSSMLISLEEKPPSSNFRVPTVKISREIKDKIKAINQEFLKIAGTQLKANYKKYSLMSVLFELPAEEVKIKYAAGSILPSAYINFMISTMKQEYRPPFRETTNILLQNLINCETSEVVKEFFQFMEKISEFFFNNNTAIRITNADKRLLKTNMNYINMNSASEIKREIQLMVDFIDGEVTPANMGDIYCPFYGEHLGNEFEYLFRKYYYGTTVQTWDVFTNRMIFSLKNMSMENQKKGDNKPLEIVGKPMVGKQDIKPMEGKPMNPLPVQQKPVEIKESNPQMDSLFLENIVNNDKIKASMIEFNKMSKGEHIYETNLLEYIKKNNAELYNVIQKWSKNVSVKTESIIKEMIELKSKFKGLLEQADHDLTKVEISYNEELKAKINFQKLINQLYILLLERLIENETKKTAQQSRGGRRDSKSRRSRRMTKKIRYKYK